MLKQLITWERFEQYNQGSYASAFENMCHILFNFEFFNNKATFISNPQNPRIEIEPIYESSSRKRISFQAKYFGNVVDYGKIKHSADYQGEIDLVYLYCKRCRQY